MVKIGDCLTHSKAQEYRLVESIINSDDPISLLEADLAKQHPDLLSVYDSELVALLQKLMREKLSGLVEALEKSVRGGEETSALEAGVLRLVALQRKLNGNSAYLKQSGFQGLYMQILVWGSRMVLSEEILRLLSEFSFDKSLKLFYYYFKYYMCHLNLYNPQEFKIGLLFQQPPHLAFNYLHKGRHTSINIPNLRLLMAQHSLPNFYHTALFLNRTFQLNLSEDDYVFHALMVKIKIVLQQDANSCVRAVLNAYWVFSYVDIAWLRSDDKFLGVPDIFPLPPNYSAFFAEFLELFSEKNATPQTHLGILEIMDSVIGLEERVAHHQDIFLSLSDNSDLIIKILEDVNSYLHQGDSYNSSVPLATLKNVQVLEKLLGIIGSQILEATQLHNLAEQIAHNIFARRSKNECSDKIIELCGQILVNVEMDEDEILKVCIESIKAKPESAGPYLNTINMLLENKHSRQRRDVGPIARAVAESEVFNAIQAIIDQETETKVLKGKGLIESCLSVIGKICSENPSLVDLLAEYKTFKTIINFLTSIEGIEKADSLPSVINFLHSISLKEGPVRDKVGLNAVGQFIKLAFRTDIFDNITHRHFGQFLMSLHRLVSNISRASPSIFKGIILALRYINKEYKELTNIVDYLVEGHTISEEEKTNISKIGMLDGRLIVLLKIIEKSKDALFTRIQGEFLLDLHKRLVRLCFTRNNLLLDSPNESKSLLNIISDLRVQYTKKQEFMKKKKKKNEEAEAPNSITFEELSQLDSFVAGEQPAAEEPAVEDHQMMEIQPALEDIQKEEEKPAEQREQEDVRVENEQAVMQQGQAPVGQSQNVSEMSEQKPATQTQEFNPEVKYDFIKKYFDRYFKTLQESMKSVDHKNVPRKIYDLLLSEKTLSQDRVDQIKVSICMSNIERVVSYINKEVGDQEFYRFKYQDILMRAQTLYSYLQGVVTHFNHEVIAKNIYNLKSIISETMLVTSRAESNKIISQELMAKELHLKLQQKWSYFHNAVEGFVKVLPQNLNKLGESFGRQLITEIVIPCVSQIDANLQLIEAKDQPTLEDYEYMRYGMKILLQFFCALNTAADAHINQPLNHVLCYYYYCGGSDAPSLMGIFARKLNLLVRSGVDMSADLRDSEQNRGIMIRRIIFKMIKSRIKTFITNAFPSRFRWAESGDSEKVLTYTYSKIRQDYNTFFRILKPSPHSPVIEVESICEEIFEKTIRQTQMSGTPKDVPGQDPRAIDVPIKCADPEKYLSVEKYQAEILARQMELISMYTCNMSMLHDESHFKFIFDYFTIRHACLDDLGQVVSAIIFMTQTILVKIPPIVSALFDDYKLIWPPSPFSRPNDPPQQSVKAHIRTIISLNIYLRYLINFIHQEQLYSSYVIQPVLVSEIIRLNSQLIGNYEVVENEDKYQVEADLLARHGLQLVQAFSDYYEAYKANISERKKQIKRKNRKLKKKARRFKRGETNNEEEDEEDIAEEEQQEEQESDQTPNQRLRPLNIRRISAPVLGMTAREQGEEEQQEEEQDQRPDSPEIRRHPQLYARITAPVLVRRRIAMMTAPVTTGVAREQHEEEQQEEEQEQDQRPNSRQLRRVNLIPRISAPIAPAETTRMQRNQSMPNLSLPVTHHQPKLDTPRQRKEAHSAKIPETGSKAQKKEKVPIRKRSIVKLCRCVQDMLVNIFICSEEHPFLTNKTLQSVMRFTKKHSMADHITNEVRDKPELIQIDLSEIIPHMMRARICEVKHQGFFHLLSEFAYHLIEPTQISVDLQMGVKRLFFEKDPNNKSEIPLKDFIAFMNKHLMIEPNSLAYFLQVKVTIDEHKAKEGSMMEEAGEKVFELSKTIIERLKVIKKYKDAKVCLKDGCELNQIDFKSQIKMKRKPSNLMGEEGTECLKTIDFCPPKLMASFVYHAIEAIGRIVVRNMNDIANEEESSMRQEGEAQKVDVFNLTILVEVLQVLIRESPSMAAFITKYKCKKIILQCLENCQPATRKLLSELLDLDNQKELPFLVFLIKSLSPLFFNRIFTLVFEMCLDSTAIQREKPTAEKPEPAYVPFGHVVRQRTLNLLMEELFRPCSLVRKMTFLNLFTMLLSIKEFSKLCIENMNIVSRLQTLYVETLAKLKESESQKMSLLAKKVLIPFFVSPISLITELNISLHYKKKESKKSPHIRLINSTDSINEQLIPNEFFFSTKFKQDWIYTGMEGGLDEADLEGEMSEDSSMGSSEMSSMFEQEMNEQFLNEMPASLSMSMGHEIDEEDYHTNSWVNNEADSEENEDSDLNDDPNTITVNIYPIGSDSIIEEESGEQDAGSSEDEEEDALEQEIRQALGEGNANSPIDNIEGSIGSDYSVLNPSRPFLARRGINIYEDFDEIITHDRNDPQNMIYRAERDQEAVLRWVLSLAGKPDDPSIKEDVDLLKVLISLKGNQDDSFYMKCGERIEFTNFQMFESFFWNMPTTEVRTISRENEILNERRDLFGFDEPRDARNRGRRNGLFHNPRHIQRMNPRDIADQIRRAVRREGIEPEEEAPDEVSGAMEPPNREQILVNQEMDEPLVGPREEGRNQMMLGEMPYHQVEEALQTQGFSMENFFNLPIEIQDDILNNIRQQMFENNEDLPEGFNQHGPIEWPGMENYGMSEPSVSERGQGESSSSSSGDPSGRQEPRAEGNQQEIPDNFKKFTQEHRKKVKKDIISVLNRDGKHDYKFAQASDSFLLSLFELYYILNENDHISFPYSLLLGLCVNSHNETKILSTLVGILAMGPDPQPISEQAFPPLTFRANGGQIYEDYSQKGYPYIALKILHTLSHISKVYSLSISFMSKHESPLGAIPAHLLHNDTLLQSLINLLRFPQISKDPENLEFLLTTINSITSIKFNLHITELMNSMANKKQKEDEPPRLSQKELHGSLKLSEQNNSLLCSLLSNDDLKENNHMVSKIIMRLSIEEENLENFIVFFKDIIKSLAESSVAKLKEFEKLAAKEQESVSHKISYKDKMFQPSEEPKIVQLLMIFYDIIKSLKASLTEEKELNIITKFKDILLCEPIKDLCETGCQIIQSNSNSPKLIPVIHEFIDCFFAVFQMLLEDNKKGKEKEKYEIKIASLGNISNSISQTRHQSINRKFISNYIDLEHLWEKKICTPQGKAYVNANIRSKLNSVLKGNRSYRQTLFDIPIIAIAIETPYMLEFDNKKSLFKAELKRLKQKKHYMPLELVLDREEVFQLSFREFMNRNVEELKGKLRIQFEGEEGEDAGGLTREWYQLLSKEMFNPNYALFTPSSTGNTYQPYSKSYVNNDHLNYFKFIGRVMGKALHDGFLLDAYFTPAFYKHILSLPITYEDMEEEDYEYYNSLKWIMNNSPIEDYMELHFTYEFDNFGEIETKLLLPEGDKILVTEANKTMYVQLVSYAKMATSVEKQLENFLQGFHEFIPPRLVRIFDEKELEVMISGLPTIEINDLKANTELVNYHKTDQIIIWLFEVLEGFDMSLRTAFLQFVTGTSRVPSDGFKGLQGFNGAQKFNIHKDFDTDHLPRAHTCFNQLDLPAYTSKEILIEKLTMAITEGKEGFGMI